jgi:hypothetical protein
LCSGRVIEDTIQAFDDYRAHPIQILYSLISALFIYFLNVGGVTITKYGTAAQRTTVNIGANIFIWMFFLFVPVNGAPLETFLPL